MHWLCAMCAVTLDGEHELSNRCCMDAGSLDLASKACRIYQALVSSPPRSVDVHRISLLSQCEYTITNNLGIVQQIE